jgi:hypothetical protein
VGFDKGVEDMAEWGLLVLPKGSAHVHAEGEQQQQRPGGGARLRQCGEHMAW